MNPLRPIILALCLVTTACTSVVSATHEGPIAEDPGKRSMGTKVDDKTTETTTRVNIKKAIGDAWDSSRIVVVCFNELALIIGQVPDAQVRTQAGQAAQSSPGVSRVENYLQVGTPIPFGVRSSDSMLTTKVKSSMLVDSNVPATRVKVVTENGAVYLMGLVTKEEGDFAASNASYVSGVQRVIKVFEYINNPK